ncbi:MAG TPA: glycoside hydrolase family 38 C-terminal domain-containing protein, partial [Flexilinea sp.]|nr:glycoside hydrolase family 38 C-terminal domain-containing protein [Flexilinea sp.]
MKELLVEALRAGKIDIGGLYVAPVSDYSFDEAVFRNFYYGKKWLLENLGIDTPLAREEDSPGHTSQFPQICQGFGMRFARFSRGPIGVFRWQSPDGSVILTHTSGYSWGYHLRLGRNFDEKWKIGFPLRLKHAEKNNYPSPNLLLSDGDDNALPNPDGPALVEAWNKQGKSPEFVSATITEYFNSIENEQFNTFSGDMPNQWAQIAVFEPDVFEHIRFMRHTLPVAELALSLHPAPESNNRLETVWRTLLECLDHNWGGRFQGAYGLEGDLYKLERAFDARKMLSEITREAVDRISVEIPDKPDTVKIIVFNTLSHIASDYVSLDFDTNKFPTFKNSSLEVLDSSGTFYEIQLSFIPDNESRKTLSFNAEDIPAMGYKVFYITKSKKKVANRKSITAGEKNIIENNFYRIEIGSRSAGIKSIFDKEFNQEIIPRKPGNLLELFGIQFHFNEVWALGFRFDPAPDGFYDNPDNEGKVGESIVITGEIKTAGEFLQDNIQLTHTDGPVFSSLSRTAPFMSGSRIDQEIILFHGTKRIGLKTNIRWQGTENYLLCMSLPFGPADGVMRMDVPFGIHRFGDEVPGYWGKSGSADPRIGTIASLLPNAVKKWLRSGFLEEKNKKLAKLKESLTKRMMKESESASRGLYNWLDVSNNDWGATLLTQHSPFDFTFGSNAILFASIRSSAFFNGEHYLRRGDNTYEYSLISYRGSLIEADVPRMGRTANSPLSAFIAAPETDGVDVLPPSASILTCTEKNIITTAVKPGKVKGEL